MVDLPFRFHGHNLIYDLDQYACSFPSLLLHVPGQANRQEENHEAAPSIRLLWKPNRRKPYARGMRMQPFTATLVGMSFCPTGLEVCRSMSCSSLPIVGKDVAESFGLHLFCIGQSCMQEVGLGAELPRGPGP